MDTVRFAYDQSDSSSAGQICAHELRALSSSLVWLNYVPLDTVLRAGYWRYENSFIKFYLRDTAGLNEKLFSLGPIVVAQKAIALNYHLNAFYVLHFLRFVYGDTLLAEITNQSASFLCVDVITMAAKRKPCFVLNKIFSLS